MVAVKPTIRTHFSSNGIPTNCNDFRSAASHKFLWSQLQEETFQVGHTQRAGNLMSRASMVSTND
eukprot:3721788-Amphidinium_carterae.1